MPHVGPDRTDLSYSFIMKRLTTLDQLASARYFLSQERVVIC